MVTWVVFLLYICTLGGFYLAYKLPASPVFLFAATCAFWVFFALNLLVLLVNLINIGSGIKKEKYTHSLVAAVNKKTNTQEYIDHAAVFCLFFGSVVNGLVWQTSLYFVVYVLRLMSTQLIVETYNKKYL